MDGDRVRILVARNVAEANLVYGILDGEGFHPILQSAGRKLDLPASMLWLCAEGVSVEVPAAEADRARETLDEWRRAASESTAEDAERGQE